jgi:hypothetical protein
LLAVSGHEPVLPFRESRDGAGRTALSLGPRFGGAMQTGTRVQPESASGAVLALRLARWLGVSLEIAGTASRRTPLALGPACTSCRDSEPRTFDRCRKRRAYLGRQAVPVPQQLAEKCPLGMRLVRRRAAAGRTLFAFGAPGGEAPEDLDAALQGFLAALDAWLDVEPGAAQAAARRCLVAAGDDLPALDREEDSGGAGCSGLAAWRTDLVVDLVTGLETLAPGRRGHALRVRVLARLLGEESGLDRAALAGLEWAALLHRASGTAGKSCMLQPRTGAVALHLPPQLGAAACQPQGLAARCLDAADALDTQVATGTGPLPERLQASLATLRGAAAEPRLAAGLLRLAPLLAANLWIFFLRR